MQSWLPGLENKRAHVGLVVFVEARAASLRLRRQRERALDEVRERIEAALEEAIQIVERVSSAGIS
jgi:hypothetical protein